MIWQLYINLVSLAVSRRTTNYCLTLAADQEKIVSEKWLPELKTAVLNAQKCLEDCKRVRGLVSSYSE